MKPSLQCLSFLLVLNLLASCNGGLSLNCNEDEMEFKGAATDCTPARMERIWKTKGVYIDCNCEEHTSTALIIAAFIDRSKNVEWLLKRGADPNRRVDSILLSKTRDKIIPESGYVSFYGGDTALITATRGAHVATVDMLLRYHVNCNVENNRSGDTALHVAASLGNFAILSSLIKAGANLNLKNNEGKTALMVAIEEGHEDIALELIAQKARSRINLDVKDNNKRTALYYARNGDGKNKEIENALLKYGATEYLLSKKIKKGAKSLFFKAAEKVPEVAPAALL